MISFLRIFTIAFLALAINAIATDKLWPRPINITVDQNRNIKLANPCQVTYNI